jgi:hypothetical protein
MRYAMWQFTVDLTGVEHTMPHVAESLTTVVDIFGQQMVLSL